MWSPQEIESAGLHIFRNFMAEVWAHLGLPVPDPIQNEVADYLQYGPKKICVEAYRGEGKTWETASFACWTLFLDPQKKVLIVSASQTYGDKIATFMKQLIDTMPILAWLQPGPGQRSSAIAFDVGPSLPNPVPSVSSVGIGGQMTGNRSDLIIADDVEVPKNSFTHLLREKLHEATKEFSALLTPKADSRIVYLGTPQCEATLYSILVDRGYEIRIWPAEVVDPKSYNGRLAPSIVKLFESGTPIGTPTEPRRFGAAELALKRAEMGNSTYAMQMLLNPTPADADRFPLKTGDFIVGDFDSVIAPIRHVWSRDRDYTLENLHSGGLEGDCWRKACVVSEERVQFSGTCMAIDPSGKGKDETAYSIVRYSQGLLYLVAVGGYTDGFSAPTLAALAATAIRFGVTHVVTEPNYGGGMFGQLLKPVLAKACELLRAQHESNGRDPKDLVIPQLVEDFRWASGQKEVRILDVLEPLIQNHKCLIGRDVIEKDMKIQAETPKYSFIYQMTRITRDKGSLAHDDRIETFAMGAEFWTDRMARDQQKMVQKYRNQQTDKELRRVLEISKQGGIVNIDRRIGHGNDGMKRKTMHKPANSHFDLSRNR